ncbi:MAG: TRAP transporter large permease subunit [Defluviicoccus sp.]|nr:TRAP transporter large permease subunit [Defluviicoccus sp.]
MSEAPVEATGDWMGRLALALAFVLVVLGMANNLPNIPGLLEAVRSIPGLEGLPRLSKYSSEFFFPLMFSLMLVVALLVSSFGRKWRDGPKPRFFLGIALDVLMLAAVLGTSLVYLIEHDQVCLIDTVSGERDRLLAEAKARADEYIAIYGTPPVEEYPECQAILGSWILPWLLFAVTIFFVYVVAVWGLPIVAVAIAIAVYTVLSSAAWYFDWTDHRYLTTSIGTVTGGAKSYAAGVIGARNAITLESNGLLGQFLNITVNIVFPYVVLGALFGASAGGRSLIKLAVVITRNLRGGPAHAAIVGSATFGTISGGPVVNVLGTGTLTIPMMMRSGFAPTFAGGVEAAASSGGQFMPPVMGIAAFVLSALSTVPYSDVIVAAFLPALAYFLSLFLVVVFEARRSNLQVVGRLTERQKLTRQDRINLLMIAGPILLILVLLLTKKDAVGTGPLGWILGYTPGSGEALPWILKLFQNAAGDPDSAGFWAVILLLALLFLDEEVRKAPRKIVSALASAGLIIAELFLLLTAVAVIDVCINFTNFTGIMTIDILNWLKTVALGTSYFTAHMFIFYFAVASAITPPVAIAAFAASTISKAEPMATGVQAVRVGIVMFTIPFVFAFYPELLLIEQAQLAQSVDGSLGDRKTYLPGYDGTVHLEALGWLVLRLVVALYLVASALSRFDAARLAAYEVALRLVLAFLLLLKAPAVAGPALAVTAAYLLLHHAAARRRRAG